MLWPQFEKAMVRHKELEGLLGDATVIADRPRYTALAKEHGSLTRMIKPYLEYKKVDEELQQAEALLQTPDLDEEMKGLAAEEANALREKHQALTSRLEDLLLGEGEDFESIIIERCV